MGRKVLRSSSEASNWSDDFGNLGAESQEGRGENRQTEEQLEAGQAEGFRAVA